MCSWGGQELFLPFLAVAKTAGARGSPAPGYSQHIPEPFFTKAKSLLAQGLLHKRVQNSCIKPGCCQQQSQTIVPVLLMAREKDGALPTARTDPHFTERKAVLKDCKCSVVLRVLTRSVRHPLVFRMAQNFGHTGFQNTYMTFII